MKKTIYIIFTTALLIGSLMLSAQVAVNTDGSSANASAMLDIKSTDKGVLIPRMTQSERNSIASPATGLLIYQSDNTPGFYYYDSSNWVIISGSGSGSGATDINSLTDGKTGGSSVFLGLSAGKLDDGSNNYNVGIGDSALFTNTTGYSNTASGHKSLYSNTEGVYNVGVGFAALSNNTSGSSNTSVGTWSLAANTTGVNNTAFGFGALNTNISGNYNTAFGLQCLPFNTTASANTALGYQAGYYVTGGGNVFLGYQAGLNETGSNKLYISNSDTINPLIYGDFDAKKVGLNGSVGIGTSSPDASASLEVSSTTAGFLPPRMTESQRDGISSPAAGLLIFQTDETLGYYYYTGTDWIGLVGAGPGAISGSISSLIDCDGNTYHAITIGNQVWMAENLRVTHYRNGDAIANVTDGSEWAGLNTGAYCWYNNDQATNEKYGALYNWYTVDDSRELCPEGWHVPTHTEWTTLTTYLGGTSVAGGKMKATSDLWASPNTNATNSSSFSGLPGGSRYYNGAFYSFGGFGYWWSSTESSSSNAWHRYLYYDYGFVSEYSDFKLHGFSVRCLRD